MIQELAAGDPTAVRSAMRAGEPSAAALEALLDELGAEEAAFVLVCYADGADHEALARVMDRRTGARGIAAHGIPGAGAGLTGFALHGGGMGAAIEIIPQLDQLSLLALDTVPRRLMRALGRGVEELKPGRHVWLTLFDAQARREPFLAPLISRWAQLELVGGSLAGPHLRQGALLHHGRLVAAGTPDEVLRPSTIAEVYGVDCDVIPHPRGGHPVIVFSPAAPVPAFPPTLEPETTQHGRGSR